MAVQLTPENHCINTSSSSSSNSPRISFSFNFCHSDRHAQAYADSSSPSTPENPDDFEFSISSSCLTLEDTSFADDIFSNGKILALDINRKIKDNIDHFHFPGKKTEDDDDDDDDEEEEDEGEAHDSFHLPTSVSQTIPSKSNSETLKLEGNSKSENGMKSFWGFRKSSSLNSTGSHGTRLCFCPIIVRCNSTGSSSSRCPSSSTTTKSIMSKKPQEIVSSIPKCHRNPKPPLKKISVSGSSLNSSSSLGLYNYSNDKKIVQVAPVLNVVCSGSLFSKRKRKNKIKPNGSSSF